MDVERLAAIATIVAFLACASYIMLSPLFIVGHKPGELVYMIVGFLVKSMDNLLERRNG